MRKLTGFWRHVVTALSVMLVLFQLYTAGFGVFPDIVQRSVHLFFVLTMLFLLMPAEQEEKDGHGAVVRRGAVHDLYGVYRLHDFDLRENPLGSQPVDQQL